jgi:hypothetical protein
MLIVASSAKLRGGLNQQLEDGAFGSSRQRGMLLGVAFVGLVFYWTLQQTNAVSLTSSGGLKADMGRFADVSIYFLLALVLVAMLAFGFRRGGDLSTPYVQSLRLIVKNAVLWVMFLASMAASVFFSSTHFAIFPSEAKARRRDPHHQPDRRRTPISRASQKRQIERPSACSIPRAGRPTTSS